MKENGNTYYYIMDRLGNVRYVLNGSGAIVQSYLYTPFGQVHSSSGSLSQPYQYVGGEGYYTEQDINLQLLGQRWYDAEVGRFISRDPIGEEGGLNLYVYVGNNPVKYKDPLGTSIYGSSVYPPYGPPPPTFSWFFFSPEIGCNSANSEGPKKCGSCEIRVIKEKVWKVIWVTGIDPYSGGRGAVPWTPMSPYKTEECYFECISLCPGLFLPAQTWSTVVSGYYEFPLPEGVSQVSAQVEVEYTTHFHYRCS